MSIKRKDGPKSSSVTINDLPNGADLIPDLPAGVIKRFPEMAGWVEALRRNMGTMQKRMWDSSLQTEQRLTKVEAP